MTDHAIINGSFSEVKFLKTRSVMQIVVEIPIEYADEALQRLGGVPQPGKETPVSVFRLNGELPPKVKSTGLAQQAGILCDDLVFQKFLEERYIEHFDETTNYAQVIRDVCSVESRSEFNTDEAAAMRWKELKREFDAWKLL